RGKLHVRLHGKKLQGEWILVKGRDDNGKNNTWYLIKGGEGMARLSEKLEDASALTGRSMEKIARAADAVWHSHRDGAAPAGAEDAALASLPQAQVKFIEPMLARRAAALPRARREWSYEIKLDGYRCLIGRDSSGVRLWSRRGIVYNREFPQLAQAAADLPMDSLIDGEVVALDQKGRPSFNLFSIAARTRARFAFMPSISWFIAAGTSWAWNFPRGGVCSPARSKAGAEKSSCWRISQPLPQNSCARRKSSASKASLPSVKIHFTSRGGGAAPGSNSRPIRGRSW